MTQTKVKFRILQQMPQAKTSRERMQKNCRSHKKAAANKRTFLVLLQLLGLDAVDGKQKREWLDEQTDGRIFEPTAGWMDGTLAGGQTDRRTYRRDDRHASLLAGWLPAFFTGLLFVLVWCVFVRKLSVWRRKRTENTGSIYKQAIATTTIIANDRRIGNNIMHDIHWGGNPIK